MVVNDGLPPGVDRGALLLEVAHIRRSLLKGKHPSKTPHWLIVKLFKDLDSAIRDDQQPLAYSRFELVQALANDLFKWDETLPRSLAYGDPYDEANATLEDALPAVARRLTALNNKAGARHRQSGSYGVLVRQFGAAPERYELKLSGPLHPSRPGEDVKNIRFTYEVRVLAESRQRIRKFQLLLEAWGIPVHPDLADFDLVRSLFRAYCVVGDVIIDSPFAGFGGVAAESLVMQSATEAPNLPSYVYDTRAKLPEPQPNKTKAYLYQWSPAIIDRLHVVRLEIGHKDPASPSGLYDYRTTKAVVESAPRIQQDLLSGNLALQELSRRLDHVLVVVTSDRKLILARRGESDVVDNLAGSWMTTVGESIDGDKDRDSTGAPNPVLAVSRCLLDYDELNLSSKDLDGARMTYLGLATEWAYLYANLLVLVELAVDSDRIFDRAVPGEHSEFAAVDFTPESCLPIIRAGSFRTVRFHRANPLVPASRVALLLSLFARFGADIIKERISSEVHETLHG